MNFYESITPEVDEIGAALEVIKGRIEASEKRLLRVIFFIAASDNDQFETQYGVLERWKENNFPAAQLDVVAQPPAYSYPLSAECCFVDQNVEITLKKVKGITYQSICYPSHCEINAFGLRGNIVGDIEESAEEAFIKVQRILDAENITFDNVVRQWNYIEKIIDTKKIETEEEQNYQIFNDVRSSYYNTTSFVDGYPAATGIGTKSGGVSISFIAILPAGNIDISPITNNRQIDAHEYSDEVLVGTAIKKTTPKFERAKMVETPCEVTTYISGTAAIVGEGTIPSDSYSEQTCETLRNIKELEKHSYQNGYLRVYINKIENTDTVKKEVMKRYPDLPTTYVEADVCRDNLIVEIEGEICTTN